MIPETWFTGHWSHVESRTAFIVSNTGKLFPMTQQAFAEWWKSRLVFLAWTRSEQ